MPSVGVQLSRVCPVCVPAPPGAFLPVLYRYCRLCGPCASLCVRVSRPCVPCVCPGSPRCLYTVLYRVCVPGSPLCLTGYGYGTVQYTFY